MAAIDGVGVGDEVPAHEHTILYLEIEGLDGVPILVIGECAKKCPFLLQVFIKAL